MFNSPFANIIEVLAFVFGVEVWESRGAVPVEPDLSKDPGVGVAHQSLADGVQAVCCKTYSV